MAQEENNQPSPSFTPFSPDTLLEKNYVFRTKPNIAVLPFTNTNTQAKETEYGRTVSAMLATALRSQTNFIVLERSELNKILSEQTLSLSG
jgi:curli biogenesis system outer membrane secretion channel CsgG